MVPASHGPRANRCKGCRRRKLLVAHAGSPDAVAVTDNNGILPHCLRRRCCSLRRCAGHGQRAIWASAGLRWAFCTAVTPVTCMSSLVGQSGQRTRMHLERGEPVSGECGMITSGWLLTYALGWGIGL
jgi:hypothetical protein